MKNGIRTPAVLATSLMIPALLIGCGSSSKDDETIDLGLDGSWGGLVVDLDVGFRTTVATIEGNRVKRVTSEGHVLDENALITMRPFNLFAVEPAPEPEPEEDENGAEGSPGDADDASGDFEGQLLADPDKEYLLFIDNAWDLGLLQKDADSAGHASLLDLNGEWSGSVVGQLFGSDADLYHYPSQGTCALGVCVFTATGPALDIDDRFVPFLDAMDNVVTDITGVQATMTVVRRDRLVFDFTFENSLGHSGSGAFVMSPDLDMVGGYACPPLATEVEVCEFALLQRQ
ncbi:hypothetical protein [Thioalkalivibrio paradoxus]|uniref:Lipoprotein n=1 Tax=Thioalkalivibrio paradoxus ARh 1 TaxID=713585 RepID=W0DSA9_9GAMM|nr:hypothetical protein [Thioalkalivibrio paradoxus]AHE99868.1 hypothetical protein THITH_02025 [Thioalkalivibrio paradoxus ARh 1]